MALKSAFHDPAGARGLPRRAALHPRPAVPAGALSLALALALSMPAAPARGQGTTPAAPRVPVLTLQGTGAASALELDGSLQAVRQSTVAAQVAGNVLQLTVRAGEKVKAGQVLVRIDERDVQAGLARTEAAVTQAEAEARNARINAERTKDLRAQGFVSQAALDSAQTQDQAAQAAVAQVRAARSQAALARGFATVTAPFDAVVQATHVDAGDLAAPGRALVTLYAPGALRAVVQLPASRSALARAATAVQVQLPDGRWVDPVSRQELAGADAVSQTVEWRLELPATAAAGLIPGQAVRVRFQGAAAPAAAEAAARLMLPQAAVLRRGELTAVYVVRQGQFVLTPVRLGATAGDKVEVLAGLKPGQTVAAQAVQAGLAGAGPAQ